MFEPTLQTARARMAAVRPADYARSRNAIDGAVTGLSPYITHGFVSLPEVLASVAQRHQLDIQHKFVFELGWREYFQHVWLHQGDAILESLHHGLLPDSAYAPQVPADIRRARTGLPVIDQAVRTLYRTGYLHNHARMWLASYVIHLRKVHWRAGADWLVAHLLDGDLASNHLSWQWVAGTGSSKPYLFNAENVARYAPAAWHSAGTVLDTSYEALDAMARSPQALSHGHSTGQLAGTDEPPCHARPPVRNAADAIHPTEPHGVDIAGRDVWLIHPWALGDPPTDLPAGCVRIGWWPSELGDDWPMSHARWDFVRRRMDELTPLQWIATGEQLGRVLAAARSSQTVANGHIHGLLPGCVLQRPAPLLFPAVDSFCPSFSRWWSRSTRGIKALTDLPGLANFPIAGQQALPGFDSPSSSRFFKRTSPHHEH